MQTYSFSLATTASKTIPSAGDMIVYESGTEAAGGDARITIKPESGDEIILKPGQGVRLTREVTSWFVKLTDNTKTVAGALVIGSGEFWDSNTSNTFKLDGTFTNSVYVNNDVAHPVPTVVAGTTQPLLNGTQKVSISQAYTGQWSNSAAVASSTPVQVVSAAANVNGVTIDLYANCMGSSSAGVAVLLAKATTPASITDGDLLDAVATVNALSPPVAFGVASSAKITVPAGLAVWWMCNIAVSAAAGNRTTVLYTIL